MQESQAGGEVDWLGLWRELSLSFRWPSGRGEEGPEDRWGQRARRFDKGTALRPHQPPDPLMEFVLHRLGPQSTILDIGAGTGRWAIPMAKVAHRVTALDPSPAMLAILREKAAAQGIANIDILQARWEEATVEPHDFALCSHAMYTSPDLAAFVRQMERSARRACFLVMRVPSHHGVLGELSRAIHGRWHDSPNFYVGYNALLSLGIYASVLMEPRLRPWTSPSLEEALERAKRHLGLSQNPQYDTLIGDVLGQRLQLQNGVYIWPDGMRSALVWWEVPSA